MGCAQVVLWLSVLTVCLLVTSTAQLESQGQIRRGYSLRPNSNRSWWSSPSGYFAFGFYPEDKEFAVGIWLRSTNSANITVVWTLNQVKPLVSSDSTVEFTNDGQLILQQIQRGQRTNISDKSGGVSASMLDSGNLVVYGNDSSIIWQSFESVTDTLLEGQSLSLPSELISSRSTSDHSSGRFRFGFTTYGSLVAYSVNSTDGISWRTMTSLGNNTLILSNGDLQQGTTSITNSSYSAVGNDAVIHRATLDADGILRIYLHRFHTDGTSNITIRWSSIPEKCQVKGFCGFNSYCTNGSISADCFCFPGFDFINPDNRYMGCSKNFTDDQGCNRKDESLLYNVEVFDNLMLGGQSYDMHLLDKEACSKLCQEDCYCGAAYYMDGYCRKLKLPLMSSVKNKWSTVFLKVLSGYSSPNVLVPEDGRAISPSKKKLITIFAASLGSVTFLCFLIAVGSYLAYRYRVNKYKRLPANSNIGLRREFTLQSFSYKELWQATDGFKETLGRGSFGTIYKGSISEDEKIVAVKQLESPEEEEERKFRAEMAIVRQTHHKNVVRLLGFCFEGARKLLVYEYMSGGTLADLLFKTEKPPPWNERVRISLDVAKAIYYLHEECEVQIIHCNIKPKNILVNDSGAAKISNFGFASILMPNQTETVPGAEGTKGYMAPERQKNDLITTKSDVYSYGVVLLEIICCRSNIQVNVSTADEVLLSSWVYKCFAGGELNQLVQDEEVDPRSLERMVKVGLLCIQDDQSLRPCMKNVILMLEGTMNVPLLPGLGPTT